MLFSNETNCICIISIKFNFRLYLFLCALDPSDLYLIYVTIKLKNMHIYFFQICYENRALRLVAERSVSHGASFLIEFTAKFYQHLVKEKLLHDRSTKQHSPETAKCLNRQTGVVAMGSPLGPTLANIIMTAFENEIVRK